MKYGLWAALLLFLQCVVWKTAGLVEEAPEPTAALLSPGLPASDGILPAVHLLPASSGGVAQLFGHY
jgi:hypothetical protein